MSLRHSIKATVLSCYNGYIVQAISINLAPLLYLTFQRRFSISLSQISGLIVGNFLLQLLIDYLASRYGERFSVRLLVIVAHVSAALGLCGLSLLPILLPPYLGLLLSMGLLGIGGGLIEVMVSPIIEACPLDGKAGNMSLLHSFYCWGQSGVILLSGLFFRLFDIEEYWGILPFLWAVFPLAGIFFFSFVPIYTLPRSEESGMTFRKLFSTSAFPLFIVMMFAAGASELTMSEWASTYVEAVLGLDKSLGDLLGPGLFAIMMGITRVLYGLFSRKLRSEPILVGCCILCIVSYLLAALSYQPWLSLIGCMLCGVSVGIFWPCTLSRASASIPDGGIQMFATLALAGDVGCLLGPSLIGKISDLLGGNLRIGFVCAVFFPVLNLVTLLIQSKGKQA